MLEKKSNKLPAVSIGMPVYNGEKYIKEAIDSVLAQTFKDFELIISDNFSTDRTELICLEYCIKDSRVRYVRQEENIGASANFEFVLKESSGKFFMWLASDDFLEKNWIEELVLNIRPDDISIRGGVNFFTQTSQNLIFPSSFLKYQFSKYFIQNDVMAKCHHIYGLFWREKLLKSDRKSFFDLEYAGDVVFVFNLLQFGNLITIATTHYNYRRHDQSLGGMQGKKLAGWNRILYRAHPWDYYRAHFKALSFPFNWIILILLPVKYVKSQFELWIRGFWMLASLLRMYFKRNML